MASPAGRGVRAAAALTVLLSACAPPAKPAAPAAAPLYRGELLMVRTPADWVVVNEVKDAKQRLTELMPPGQTPAAWVEMISIATYYGAQAKAVEALSEAMAAEVKAICGTFESAAAAKADSNGFATAFQAWSCTDPKPQPGGRPASDFRKEERHAWKILQGQDSLYIVKRFWHGDAPDARRPDRDSPAGREWQSFFDRIELCDTRALDRGCAMMGVYPAEEAERLVAVTRSAAHPGCRHFAQFALVPDPRQGSKAEARITPLALGKGRIPDEFLAAIKADSAAALRDNAAFTLILGVSDMASEGLAADRAKIADALNAFAKAATDGGAPADRLVLRLNPACMPAAGTA